MPFSQPSTELPVQVSAFYKFADFPDYAEHRDPLLKRAETLGLRGSVLLASEGINGTLAGEPDALNAFLEDLRADPRFAEMELKHSFAATPPFRRIKVRLKKEIVTLGEPSVDPKSAVGQYVEPSEWNALIGDPGIALVDTRNAYETEVGMFEGAIDPGTDDFREFPAYVARELDPEKHPKVAMYCTGGIRCEKATNLLLQRGFKEVYHLKGGILNYLEKVPAEESLWRGECFVFDRRVTVDHSLRPGQYTLCDGCDRPLTPEDRASPLYREGVHCAACRDQLTPEKQARLEERQRQRSALEKAAFQETGGR